MSRAGKERHPPAFINVREGFKHFLKLGQPAAKPNPAGLGQAHPATYRPDCSCLEATGLCLLAPRLPVGRSPAGQAVQGVAGRGVEQSLVGALLLRVHIKIHDQLCDSFVHITCGRKREMGLSLDVLTQCWQGEECW